MALGMTMLVIIMIILKLGTRKAMKKGMMMDIAKVQINLRRRKTKIVKEMNSLNLFFCIFVRHSLKRKKEATQIFYLRGFCYYSEGYFCTFVILSIRLLGCLSKAHELLSALLEKLISSSGKVL